MAGASGSPTNLVKGDEAWLRPGPRDRLLAGDS